MRNPVMLFMIFFCTVPAFPQTIQIEEYNHILEHVLSLESRYLEYKDIDGNPYSNEELIPGTIAFVSGNHMENVPLRYNWYRKDMEFENEGKILAIPVMQDIDYIVINDTKYVPFYYIKTIRGYLIEVVKGDYSLFRNEDVRFIDAKPPASGYDQFQPAKFEWKNPRFIVITSNSEIFEINTNKKKFPLQFPGFEEEIETFCKEHRINLKNETDLKSVIDMLNSLQQESNTSENN